MRCGAQILVVSVRQLFFMNAVIDLIQGVSKTFGIVVFLEN